MKDGHYFNEYNADIYVQDGKYHRIDGPAINYFAGPKRGSQFWYKNGKLHREDGPAIIRNSGLQYWYQDGELHREDGPAVISPSGKGYWFNNYCYPDIKNNIQWLIKIQQLKRQKGKEDQ